MIFGNDPIKNIWIRKADFGGSARDYAVGFNINGKGYIGTGDDDYLTSEGNKKDFWEYDQGTDSWTRKKDLEGNARFAAVGFSIDSKGYIGTGYDWDGHVLYFAKDYWEYNPDEIACIPPADLKVVNITDTSARLKWNVTDSVKGFCIIYRAINTFPWQEKRRRPEEDHITLTGLSPNTTYLWKMRSACKGGFSQWVTGPRFTTTSSWEQDKTITISPNPVTDNTLVVHFQNKSTTIIQLTISNWQGQNFVKQKFTFPAGTSNKTFDVSELPKDIYILKITNNKNEQQQIKFVKTN